MNFGETIKAQRIKLKLSQADVANMVRKISKDKKTNGYLSKIENRSEIPSRTMIIALAEILRLDEYKLRTIAYKDKVSAFESKMRDRYLIN